MVYMILIAMLGSHATSAIIATVHYVLNHLLLVDGNTHLKDYAA